MTACFAAGAAARFFGNSATPLSPFPAAPVLPRKTAPAPPWCSPGCGISGIEPWLSSPGIAVRRTASLPLAYDRATQYSRDARYGIERLRRTGSPAFAGDDGWFRGGRSGNISSALPLFHPCQQRQPCDEKQHQHRHGVHRGCGISGIEPWLSSPGSTGRPSIPATPVMELRGCGVLGHPLSRVMTACFAAGAAARFFGNSATPLSPLPAAPVLPRKTAPAPPCPPSGFPSPP
jgi:hypothetical protein